MAPRSSGQQSGPAAATESRADQAGRWQAMTDQQLVCEVLAGDRDAYGVLVDRHGRDVARAVWYITRSATETEDLTQDAFSRAYFALATYKPEFPFGAWLRRIGCNLALNALAQRRRDAHFVGRRPHDEDTGPVGDPVDPDRGADPVAALADRDRLDRTVQAIDALPEHYRHIVVLRHEIGLSYEEIAAVTRLPMGTVKSRLRRARRLLAKALADDVEG